jgi:hypothetical protein
MKIKSPLGLGFISFLLFFIAAIYITYPLIFHINDMATGYGDELVIAWIQNWVIHALMTSPFSIFEANIYYPYHNTLAFSETFIFTSILALPIKLLTGEPISTVNFTLISSIIFLGFSMYLLCFYVTRNFFASLFSGMMIIFSSAVLDYTVHLQILSIACVPLSILFFLHFVTSRRSLFLGISLVFFILQLYNSILPSYFIVFSFLIIALFMMRPFKKKIPQFISKKNSFLLVAAIICMIPLAIPYYSVSHEFHYVRDIRDTIHFALQPEDFLYPGNRTSINDFLMNAVPTNHYSQNNEFKPGYLGVVFSVLVLLTVIYLLKNRKRIGLYEKCFLTIALLGLILSLGPFLHIGRQTIHHPFPIPLPYLVFYYLFPGFNSIRDSGNWNMLFIIGISVVIALVLNNFLAKFSHKTQIFVYLVLLAGVVLELNFPLKLYSIPQVKDFPKVYSWMATTPQNAIFIELPIYNWNYTPYVQQELYREYFGTINFRRTVNGYTGFSPPPWQDFISDMHQNFPSDKSIQKIQKLGVQYIIINKNDFDAEYRAKFEKYNGDEVIQILKKDNSVSLVKKFDDGIYVFIFDAKK